ncbi:hypothetical protein ABBQ32_006614 [Trebouxia sp. C0010 RCD-2024]
MQSVKALRRWLVIVALLRLLAVFLGYFNHTKFQTNLFDNSPREVTELCGRVFAIWTLLTCALCCICARNPCVPSIYGATFFSFVAALCFFLLELFVYQTVSWKSALQPLIVAGVSTLWMGAGWNYYTTLSLDPDSSIVSEPETESAKRD